MKRDLQLYVRAAVIGGAIASVLWGMGGPLRYDVGIGALSGLLVLVIQWLTL